MKEISAGGVVYKREGDKIKILLIEDRYHKITIPKGKQEPGETLAETALREIKEETGIEGRIVQPLDVVHYQYNGADRGWIDKEVTYYLVESIGGKLTVQEEEINEAFWAELEEAHQLQQEKGYVNNEAIMEQAYRYLKQLS